MERQSHLQYARPGRRIRHPEADLAVETPGPSQRGVEVVGTIRGPDHNDSLPARVFHREGVHTGQELFVFALATGGFRI